MFFESQRDKSRYFHRGDNACLPHFHRSAEILYVLEGEKQAVINGETFTLREGDVLFCPPYAVHRFLPSEGKQLVGTVSAEYFPKFEQFCRMNEPCSPYLHDTNGEFLRLLTALEDPKNEVLLTGIANCLFGLYMERMEFIPSNSKGERSLIEQIATYVDEHYAEPITLPSLAETFGYSPNYFSSLFKKFFTMGVVQYVNFIRIRKSVKLLQTQKISTVYFSVGFRSPQQYFLNFKKYYGCTPKEYMGK